MEFNFKAPDIIKHSAAHVLAAAVKRIFPNLKIGIGPVTKTGFFYDFELDRSLTDEDLKLIEKNINQIIQENLPFNKIVISKQEGLNMLLQIGQIYKAELLQSIPEEQVSFYKLGEEFIDLCRGPHVKSTNEIGIIKLTNYEEVYWNDDSTRPKMYRIHGVVFQNIVEYNEYIEAVKAKDNRHYIKYSLNNNLMFKDNKNNLYFTEVGSSLLLQIERLVTNEFFDLNLRVLQDVLNPSVEEVNRVVNLTYNNKNRSYKTLPISYKTSFFEDTTEDKYKVNTKKTFIKFYSNTANSINDLGGIVEKLVDISNFIAMQDINIEIRCFDLEHTYVKFLSGLLQKKIISHNQILTKKVGSRIELEFNTIDSVGKPWSLLKLYIETTAKNTTYYTNKNNKEETQSYYIVADIGNIFAYLVEERRKSIPFELKPTQVICIPKSNKQIEFALRVRSQLMAQGFRTTVDTTSKSFKAKIRNAENKNYNFILVIGNKEEANEAVSVRQNHLEVGLVSLENLRNYIIENKDNTK